MTQPTSTTPLGTASRTAASVATGDWHPTACILCECNCGVEIRLGNDGRTFERLRGDKAHPGSKGYTCEKALRLDAYQNGRGERVLLPQRRRSDGTFETIDWDTAVREIADRFSHVRDTFGGASIMYYGGGGQGNHLGGGYCTATRAAFGMQFRSNALAQEKTGDFWVNGRIMGTGVRSDVEHAEVVMFIGKNPWQTHGFPHARTTLKEIAADPGRTMIVIDPRRTETAELADVHLRVRPATDAWLLAAMVAVLVQERLTNTVWLAANANGVDRIAAEFAGLPVAEYCAVAGIDEATVRSVVHRIASAKSVSVVEDLGIQMNRQSTLNSYLEKLIWLLTGNLGNVGGQYAPSSLVSITGSGKSGKKGGRVSPVTGSRIISGLMPCNVIADEILTDHPDRFRAMLVETANPAHSLADSPRVREALRSLDTLVVIDVFMTETARLADYVLPAPTQFEKWEATFFNFEFPRNVFHLRRPVVAAPEGPLPEPEIHARLVEATGVLDDTVYAPLRVAAGVSRSTFAAAFFALLGERPELGALSAVILYRTLGESLPDGAAAAALLWGASHTCARNNPDGVRRAGHGEGLNAGEQLFDAILASPSGVVITDDEYDATMRRLRTDDGRVDLVIDELLDELRGLDAATVPGTDPTWPFVLSAGERRSFTANTIVRDPAWRKKDADGALRINPHDAAELGLSDGSSVRVVTERGSAIAPVAVTDVMQRGHVSLPNGYGLDHLDAGNRVVTGIAPNDLTATGDRDPIAGTPWHKSVPARLEPVGA